jgi:DHA1 family multidrug resistance protein-like MFS transporter
MVLRTTFAISVFTFCMGLCQNVWELLFTRMMQGVFSGFSASAIALVATVIPEERLGYSLGWLQSAGMIGSLIGPLAGGFLSDYVHSYRVVFFLTSGFAMTAFVITALLVKERFVREDEASAVRDRPRQKKPSIFGQFRAARGLTAVRTMFLVLFLAQFSVMSVQPVLPVYIKELTSNMGHLGSIAGFAFSMTGLADLIGSPFLGKRSDKLGYRKVLTICLIGAGLFYLGQACAPNVWFFIAARFGLGLFVGGILPTANALVGRLTPKDERGKVYGFTSSATFLGAFAGPIIGGFGSAVFGIRAMLCVTCVLYVFNMIWVRRHVVEPNAVADQPGA